MYSIRDYDTSCNHIGNQRKWRKPINTREFHFIVWLYPVCFERSMCMIERFILYKMIPITTDHAHRKIFFVHNNIPSVCTVGYICIACKSIYSVMRSPFTLFRVVAVPTYKKVFTCVCKFKQQLCLRENLTSKSSSTSEWKYLGESYSKQRCE